MIAPPFDGTFEGWRARARALLAAEVPPDAVSWDGEGQGALPLAFAAEPVTRFAGHAPRAVAPAVAVPRAFVAAARRVALHAWPGRWALLYRLVWRLAHGEPWLLEAGVDPDGLALERLLAELRADVHRVHALARFRPIHDETGAERWIAWHRPDHRILAIAAPFFARRYASLRWSLLSPDESAHWDGRALALGPGVAAAPPAAAEDDEAWRAYYASTFNPARANPQLLRRLLPERFHATLPEARELPALLRGAAPTVEATVEATVPQPASPARPSRPATSTRAAAARPGARASR